ncbi:MAG TPA: hypothetical protein VFA38_10195 [Nitrospirales bacterium]|nr:hypothetical protein [Nitrospirales bacterium]
MAKAAPDKDLSTLKEKVRTRRAASENPEGDAAIRRLRKRLKREQRKRRRLTIRKQHAAKKTAETKTEAPAS